MDIQITAEDEGARLDAALAPHVGSRSRAQRLIEAGAVSINGELVIKRHRVAAGEVVVVDEELGRRRPEPDAAPADFVVAYEDEYLLVVDKPAGVVVHPARGHASGTLVQALSGRAAGGDDEERPGIVHRLDRDTSGLLVVARDEATHRQLKTLLQAREITREYVALVGGRPPARTGTIDAPIGRDRHDRLIMSTDTDHPRTAITHFEITEALAETTLLRVRLETGRTHQIRAHLHAIGHGVVGDPAYGAAPPFGLTRQFLHARRLAFVHPATGVAVDVTSPLPDDLQAALALARSARA